jgi:regulator of RNase E activity RraB
MSSEAGERAADLCALDCRPMGLRRLFRRDPQPSSTPGEGDRLILDQLRNHGADLTQPREVLHYSYFADRAAADAAAGAMRDAGYRVTVEESASGDGTWLALATAELIVDESTVDSTRARFEGIAAEHGGDYDGWEAAVS